MDFLNIGSGEFLFLILLAILLIGPGRAVELVSGCRASRPGFSRNGGRSSGT